MFSLIMSNITNKKLHFKKDFDFQKKLCMDKLYKSVFDKSRKGSVDKPIMPLIDYINNLKNYYTTSSCSGRIQILTEADKKHDVKWLYQSHEKTPLKEILEILKTSNIKKYPEGIVWLRQENMILHIACRTIDDANKVLKIARDIGLRRSGIIADSNIIIVEVCSTEQMDVPIAKNGKLIVDKGYIKIIVDIANKKFLKGREKLEKLEEEIRNNLK